MATFQHQRAERRERPPDREAPSPAPLVSNSGMAARAHAVRSARAAQAAGKPTRAKRATRVPGLKPPIAISHQSLSIAAKLGSVANAQVRVTAEAPCAIRAAVSGGNGAFKVRRPKKSVELEAGGTVEIEVEFLASEAGNVKAGLELTCTTKTGSLELDRVSSVPLLGLGGTKSVGNGDVKVEIRGEFDPVESPAKRPPAKREKKRRAPSKAPPSNEKDRAVVELFDAADYSVEELGQRVLDKMIAGLTQLDGALEIFGDVVSAPSKNEAKRASAGSLAIGRAGDLFIKLAAKPLLATLPGGAQLYQVLKAGLSVARDAKSADKAAKRASAKNKLKDFTTDYRAQLTSSRAAVESHQQEIKVALRRDYASLKGKDARENRKLEIFARGSQLQQSLAGELSITALFTQITSDWMKSATVNKEDPNRLIIDLDENWKLISGNLKGPSGDRCAEQLMKMHGGSLNVKMLGLPIQVRWFPPGKKDRGSFVTAWLATDGTVETVRPVLVFPRRRAVATMKRHLATKGIPEVTKLVGTEAG